MLIQSVPFSTRGPKPQPQEIQEASNGHLKPTSNADNLVLISLPTTAIANLSTTQNLVSSLPNFSNMKVKTHIDVDSPALLGLETLALSEDQASSGVASGADSVEQTRLFGIYTGQIQARIDRVWRRPRTPVDEGTVSVDSAGSFRCEAQIIQDIRGNVQEILLPRCNGSVAWQRSLVLAIQQASPLPAPPNVKVFTQSITLNFVGLPYVQGASSEEYEIAPLARVAQ